MLLLVLLSGWLLAAQDHVGVAPVEIRQRLMEVINADRAAAGLPPVEYSEELSRAADEHCRDMLAGDYVSHWDRRGWKPYLRYAAAGIRDATSENIHAFWSSDFRPSRLWDYLVEGHRGFMLEKPPRDGHRRSILDARHTHVGIGVAYNRGSLRLIEVFGGRYAELEPLPFRARPNAVLTVAGRLLRSSDKLLGISVFYEPLPSSMDRAELRATYSYCLPEEEHLERPVAEGGGRYVDGTTGSVHVNGRTFHLPLRFWKGKPGVYTIAVWVDPGGKPAFIGASTSLFME